MSKKFNNKTLFIVFAVLLAVFLLSKVMDFGKNDRNFRTELVNIDTAQVTAIVLYPKEDTAAIKLVKENGRWHAQKGSVTAQADPQAVEGLFSTLLALKPQRLASRSPEKWNTFEVTDSLGTRVKVMNNEQVIADLMIGKFSLQQMASQQNMPPMQQQQPKATSYVRLADEDEVYAVDGFLATTFNRSFSNWRDRTFLSLNEDSVIKISFNYPADSGFVAVRVDSIWRVGETQVDSAQMANYLSRLSRLNSTDFADNFSTEGKQPQFEVIIERENSDQISIEGYQGGNGFVLRSTQKPDVFINSDSTGLFSQVFIGKEELLAQESK